MNVTSTPKVQKVQTSPAKGDKKIAANQANFRNLFVAAAVSMSWQLAIVVVVPIVGGYELDQHFHTTPALTVTGFVLAALGFYGVIRRVLSDLGDISNNFKERK